jgi:CheY-like chemotaxis protein
MGQSKHILVVDDNGDVREVIVDVLQLQNYRVSTASSGSVMRDFLETGDGSIASSLTSSCRERQALHWRFI